MVVYNSSKCDSFCQISLYPVMDQIQMNTKTIHQKKQTLGKSESKLHAPFYLPFFTFSV